jgi:transposase
MVPLRAKIERSFIMDYTALKKLGLDRLKIDSNSSYESFDPSTNNDTIFIHLIKTDTQMCPCCGVIRTHTNRGSKSQKIKYSCAIQDNIDIVWFRRQYRCKDCGRYFQEENPFSFENKSTSIFKEKNILEALKNITATYKSVALRFNVSDTYVQNTFDKNVSLSRLPLPEVMCVDEVYAKKLSFHKYCMNIYDPMHRKIIDVLPSRHKDILSIYFSRISAKERGNVRFFSTDLYETYRQIAKKYFYNAVICADPFHVIENLSNCLHNVRRHVMYDYAHNKKENDDFYWMLKDHWKLLTMPRHLLHTERYLNTRTGQFMSQSENVQFMLYISEDLRKAYDLYQDYLEFNSTSTLENARERLDKLIDAYKDSRIKQYIPAWKMLENWHDEIINSFSRVNGRRVTNGPMERANENIKTIFRLAYGARNFERMRNRIMFVMNSDSPTLYEPKKYTNKHKYHKRGHYNKNK